MRSGLTVSQSAREAATALIEWHNKAASEWHIESRADLRFFAIDMPDGIRRGIWDEYDFVQAFASFERDIREQCAREVEADLIIGSVARQRIATAIREQSA